MRQKEEEFYEIAGSELLEGNYKVGLWNKAFSMALGDDAKSKAIYMKLRVEEMKAEVVKIEQSNSANLAKAPLEFMPIVDKSDEMGLITKEIKQNSPANQFSSNISSNNLNLNNKGFKYYIGFFISILGYALAIPHILLPGLFSIKFIWSEFGVIFGVIAFFLFPLTALIGPFLLGLYTNNYKIIIESFIWIIFISIIIGIGHWLRKPFRVKNKSNNLAQPKIAVEEDEKTKLENIAIRNLLIPLRSMKYQDADNIIKNFDGPPSLLQYPIKVDRASGIANMLEFRIINLIKQGYLKGVRHNDEWYLDIFEINSENNKNSLQNTEHNNSIKNKKNDNDIVYYLIIIFFIIFILLGIGGVMYLSISSSNSPAHATPTPRATVTPSAAPTPRAIVTPSATPTPRATPTPAPRPASSDDFDSITLRAGTYLEIREAPVNESKIIAKFPAGSYNIKVKNDYTDLNGKGWTLIKIAQYEGWVTNHLLSKIKN